MAILVHPTSLSLLPPSSSSSRPPTPLPLPLPSRFPRSSPRSAATPGGHTFIWSASGTTLWEYDPRGRRVGELSVPSPVVHVSPFERGVAVASTGDVRIFRRASRASGAGARRSEKSTPRWTLAHTLGIGGVTALGAGGGVLLVCAEQVSAFAIDSGTRMDLPLFEALLPVRVLAVDAGQNQDEGLAFLLPSTTGLVRVTATGVTAIPLPLTAVDVAVAGDCVAAVGREMLALVPAGLDADADTEFEPKLVALGHEAAGVAFLDPHTVAVWTTEGTVLLVDVASRLVTHTPHTRVLAIHPASSSASAVAQRQRAPEAHVLQVLTERTNVAHAPNVSGSDATVPKEKKVGFKRAVSAPDPPSAASTARIRTNPHAHANAQSAHAHAQDPDLTTSTAAPTPLSHRTLDPQTVQDCPSDHSPSDHSPSDRSTSDRSISERGPPGPGWDAVDDLRREIGNLQLDMLRMGRALKNEIRAAVAPLVDELRASREMVAAQQAEIERLRRGY
ncbi:hypothetical protein CspeluHIS016_0306210 [Cutaneotrichosporon spelunceum]|uniref:Uncharacterized protein n=1 Tax=Cutaneotrichosporon spelunceum TaxID=1672016 RepID=A0AAD3YB94_9TREE|nr:hypothetical protein CspeluHIS016_0306210 [Cutaneotrichosporon spelunceum]